MPEPSPKGQQIESEYDLAGRVTQTVHKRADATVEETRVFTYDPLNRLVNVKEQGAAEGTVHEYDHVRLGRGSHGNSSR